MLGILYFTQSFGFLLRNKIYYKTMTNTQSDIEQGFKNKANSSDYTCPETKKTHKMNFIYNALENGWTIKKRNEYYIFKKRRYDCEEVFLDSFLTDFISDNSIIKKQ